MASVSTYLNFRRETEAAFTFYKSVFGTEYQGGIMRHGDIPASDEMAQLSDEDKNLIINVALPTIGGHIIMGSDLPESMGIPLTAGTNVQICLHPDTRTESDRLFAALSEGGTAHDPMSEMFWGDYYGSLTDKFGINWLINCSSKT